MALAVFSRGTGGMTLKEYILSLAPEMYLRLGDTSGAVALDETAQNHDGDYCDDTNAAISSATTSATALTDHIIALDGQAASPFQADGQRSQSFDGVDHFVRIPDHADLDAFTSTSFCAWVKMDTPDAAIDQVFMGKIESGANSTWRIRRRGTGTVRVVTTIRAGGSTVDVDYNWTSNTNTNFWCVTWNGTDIIVYYNGASVATGTVTGTMDNNGQPASIGRFDQATPEFFDGTISDVALWKNVVLTPAQVKAIYTIGSTGSYSTLAPTATIQKLTKRILA